MTFSQPNAQPNTTPTTMFAQPGAAGTSDFDLAANLGALLMITATGTKEMETIHGPAEPVEATIVALDGPNAGQKFEDVLIFPKVLANQLRKFVGKDQTALGRLGQGEKKPGKNAPWMLQDFTPQDAEIAQAWINQNMNDLPTY